MALHHLAAQPRIVFGAGARREAGSVAATLAQGGPALLVADPGIAASPIVADVAAALAASGFGVERFSDFTGDPTISQADAAADNARHAKAQIVVAMGGGSALDLAKSVAAIASATNSALYYQLCEHDLPARRLPILAIPTTSGTGSEATRTAILTRTDKAKVWLWGEALKPDAVLLDPEATLSLPAPLTAATGIDAFIHALEAATNANASAPNNVHAHEAMRLCTRWLARAVADGGDLEARGALARAAMLSGVAIDNAGTAAGHMIGHALGSLAPIHHGRAVAIGMAASLAWNIAADDGRWQAAAEAIHCAKAAELPQMFERLARGIGLNLSIAADLPGITAERLAAQFARPENAAMRRSNLRTIADDDLVLLAQNVIALTD
jgi:alcohol dehydrogenase